MNKAAQAQSSVRLPRFSPFEKSLGAGPDALFWVGGFNHHLSFYTPTFEKLKISTLNMITLFVSFRLINRVCRSILISF